MSELQAQPAAQQEWRQVLSELVDAMRRYEMDVHGEADQPARHREMMERAEALLKESQPRPAVPDAFAGVKIWIGDKQVTKTAPKFVINREMESGMTITLLAQSCLNQFSGKPEPEQPHPDWTPYLMLAEFGRKCFESITDARDVEWDTAFDIAREVGLLVPEQRNEPCEAEGACRCNDEGVEFPATCYRPTSLVNALLWKDLTQPDAAEVAGGK